MKKILVKTLRFLAKKILKKYKPEIIGVTGSFGKTSTKEAVFAVLSSKFNVRRNIKNYNNEIGLPLTIIGAGSPGRSVLGWLGVFFQAFFLLVLKQDYPKILILEMAVDHPGDMDYLVDLALPKIGVVANIGAVHLEYFKTVERIAKEKAKIVTRIKDGWAVLNADNELVLGIKDQVKCPVLTYGLGSKADLRAQEINISHNDLKEKGIAGISFKMIYQGNVMPVLLPNILGEHLVYAALAGAALGIIYGMNLMEISQALQSFKAPKGRMNLIDGIKKTLIIDDTYNAGPDSTLAALKVLGRIPGRRWAVLGDMLELGEYTEEAHRKVGESMASNKIDFLITVGERARIIASEAEKGLGEDRVFSFPDAEKAGLFLQDRMESGDIVLVKGSQGMRMEKIVKEVMAEPLKAKDLLVRQDKPWE